MFHKLKMSYVSDTPITFPNVIKRGRPEPAEASEQAGRQTPEAPRLKARSKMTQVGLP